MPSALRLDPARTGLLAQAAYRTMATERLRSAAPMGDSPSLAGPAHGPDPQVRWHWPAVANLQDEDPSTLRSGNPTATPPPLKHHYISDSADWLAMGLARLHRDVREVRPGLRLACVGTADPWSEATVQQAINVTFGVWAEAAMELRLLIRRVVHLAGPFTLTASLASTFGVIYCSEGSLRDSISAAKAMLRESAVHSLWLHDMASPLVAASDSIGEVCGSHGRSARGALYSAHSTARIANFFARRCASADATPLDHQVRGESLVRLHSEVEQLERIDILTSTGKEYVAELRQDLEALAHGNAL